MEVDDVVLPLLLGLAVQACADAARAISPVADRLILDLEGVVAAEEVRVAFVGFELVLIANNARRLPYTPIAVEGRKRACEADDVRHTSTLSTKGSESSSVSSRSSSSAICGWTRPAPGAARDILERKSARRPAQHTLIG